VTEPRWQARRRPTARGTVSRAQVVGVNRNGNGAGAPRAPRSGSGALRGLFFLVVLGALVLFGLFTFVGPAVAGFARGFAESNPNALRWPFVAGLIAGDMADEVAAPASDDATPVRFEVQAGASASEVGRELAAAGLIKDRFTYDYLIVTRDVGQKIEAGTYLLNKAMTPEQIVDRLQDAPETTIEIGLREGLRIEQITALLESLELQTDVAQFYELASKPPNSILRDYEFLSTLPEGRSLEGYLGAGSYAVFPDVTAEELLRRMLDRWQESVDADLIQRAEDEGRDFYEVLTLASIVEKEATLPDERPLIAGVYQNRVEREMLLNADPTVFYAWDTLKLRELDLAQWPEYAFWTPIGVPLAQVEVPRELSGFQTYQQRGLIPGPICSPSPGSIEAALEPDQAEGYLYFVAIPGGEGAHAFAKTQEEHEENLRKYGYL